MKPLIAYVSRTGNTTRVVQPLAEVLGADLRVAGDVDDATLCDRPLVGLGSGVYWLKHDPQLLSLIERIGTSTPVFTVTTSGFRCGFLVRYYQRRLRRKLQRHGLQVVGQFYSPGHDKFVLFRWMGLSKGRPDAADLERARTFAKTLTPRWAPVVASGE